MSGIHILFFGSLADHFGRSLPFEIDAAGEAVAAIRARLAEINPAVAAPGVRAAVRQLVAGEDVMVRPGDELAFFSPVSGG